MTAIIQIYAHYHRKSSFSPKYPIKYSQTYLVTHKYARKGMEWLNYGETLCECVGGVVWPLGTGCSPYFRTLRRGVLYTTT